MYGMRSDEQKEQQISHLSIVSKHHTGLLELRGQGADLSHPVANHVISPHQAHLIHKERM